MSTSEPRRRSPYQGLIPYSERDAPFFFGREKETRLIAANLFASPLTLLYGASGVGKSSVLHAGVEHQLRKRDDLLVVFFNAWQSDPISDLREAIVRAAGSLDGKKLAPSSSLAEFLANCSQQLNRRVMIILDQFEEYFLYHSQEDAFSAELPRAVMRSDSPVSFLISLREDALAKLDRFEGRIPTLFDNYLRIEHLNMDAGRAAILKPIEKYNRLYAVEPPVTTEPALVETVLQQVRAGEVILGETGQGVVKQDEAEAQIETPYLQMVMMRLWDEEIRKGSRQLRLETLRELGGAKNIVRTHLDTAMSGLPAEEQTVAARVFHHLVTPSGAKIAHTVPDLADYADVPQEQLSFVMKDLLSGDVRILRGVAPPPDQPDEPRYEIFHDVLAPAILDWRARFVKAQEFAEAEKQLAVEAEERAKAERQLARERSLVKRFRWSLIVMALLLIAMLAVTAFAFKQRAEADKQRAEADSQRALAEDQRRIALEQSGLAVQRQVEAEQALKFAESQFEKAKEATAEANKQKDEADKQRNIAKDALARALGAKAEAEKQRAVAEQALNDALASKEEADRQRGMAEEQRNKAQASEVTAKAIAQLQTDPNESLISAQQAVKISSTERAIDALRQALLESHLKAVLKVSGSKVLDAEFSPDGKLAMTSNDNGKILLWNVNTGELKRSLEGYRAAFSPDGKFIVTANSFVDQADSFTKHYAAVWRVEKEEQISRTERPLMGSIDKISFSQDGEWILAYDQDVLIIWDARTGQSVYTTYISHASDAILSPDRKLIAVTANQEIYIYEKSTRAWLLKIPASIAAFSPNSGLLVTADPKGEVDVWSVDSFKRKEAPKPLVRLQGHTGLVRSISFSPDGTMFATAGNDKTARVWRTKNYSVVSILAGHEDEIVSVSFSPDNQWVVTASADNTALVWGAYTGEIIARLRGHKEIVSKAAFDPTSKLIVTASHDGTARIWSMSSAAIPLEPHSEPITNAMFSPNSSRMVATSDIDGLVTLWQLDPKPETLWHFYPKPIDWTELDRKRQKRKEREVAEIGNLVKFSSDGKFIFISGRGLFNADVSDAATGHPITTLEGHSDQVVSVDFSKDSKQVVTASSDGTVRIWDTTSGTELLKINQDGMRSAIFSPDGKFVATAGATVRVWDAHTGQPIAPPFEVNGTVMDFVAFSPDGKQLAAATKEGAIAYILDSSTGQVMHNLKGHKKILNAVSFSPDGRFILTASDDSTARVWDAKTGEFIRELRGHMRALISAVFSPDGKLILTASADNTARLWNASTGNLITILRGHHSAVNSASFSPDGKYVITTSSDGIPRVYTCEVCGTTEELLDLASKRIVKEEPPPKE